MKKGKAKEILLRFMDGKIVEKDEYPIVEPYWRIGVIHIGFSFSNKETQAKLTERGKRLLGCSV